MQFFGIGLDFVMPYSDAIGHKARMCQCTRTITTCMGWGGFGAWGFVWSTKFEVYKKN